jgi:hypothetical protein
MHEPLRIGVLCIHGIGEQQRTQHVDQVARQFRRHLNALYGIENVFVEALPGIRTKSVLPDVSFVVRTKHGLKRFDLVEVWWRDLSERPGFKHLVKFWWWALTLWTTSGFAHPPAAGRSLPEVPGKSAIGKFSIKLVERARLFFQSVSFFVLLLPAQIIISLLAMIPFIRRIDVLMSVYSYLSSVKLYQQERNETNQDVLDQVISRRIRIQKRVCDLYLSMAEAEYERWFIVAHSLGSVIAYKSLMYNGEGFARALGHDRWHRLNADWKTKSPIESSNFLDEPPLPWWLETTDAINLEKVYDRLGGLITYGSPIETFATLWPSIVEINNDPHHLHANWINLYDSRDFISSPIKSFDSLHECLPITNIEIDSHWLIPKSHTNYFTIKRGSSKAVQNLISWFSGGMGTQELRDGLHAARLSGSTSLAMALQVIVILVGGAAIFPLALYGTWKGISGLVNLINRFVVTVPDPYGIVDRIDDHIDHMFVRFGPTPNFYGLVESLLIVGGALLIFGLLKASIIRLRQFLRYGVKDSA